MSKSSRANSARNHRKKNFTSAKRHIPTPTYPYSTASICAGMARLPQELRDIVYDFVFTPLSLDLLIEKSTYKPPVELQIDRQTRREFRSKYYGPDARYQFTYHDGTTTGSHADALYKWWGSLDDETQALVSNRPWISRPSDGPPRPGETCYLWTLVMRCCGTEVNYRYKWTGRMETGRKMHTFSIGGVGLMVKG